MVHKVKSDNPIRLIRNVTEFKSWKAPAIDIDGAKVFRQELDVEEEPEEKAEELISSEELQSIKDQAYTEGFEIGRKEGLSSAQNEVDKKNNLLNQMVVELADPLRSCGEQSERELLELAFAIAKQVVRREMKQDPTQLIAIIRESLRQLPISSKEIKVLLHPDDASIIREVMSLEQSSVSGDTHSGTVEQRWQIIEEPSMQSGGCVIKTKQSKIDASIDQQIAILFSQMVDEQRTSENRENPKKEQSSNEQLRHAQAKNDESQDEH